MTEENYKLATADGVLPFYLARPDHGTHPLIILYMDAYGIRQELRDMALRLASSGYCVALPNLYYRIAGEELGPIPEPDEFDRLELLNTCVQSLTIVDVMDDTKSLVVEIERLGIARTDRVGTVGYCMSGRFAVAAAARFPSKVKAAVSVYGTWLVSKDPESPHLAATKAPGRVLFLCAEEDHWVPPAVVAQLREHLSRVDTAAVEVFAGTSHAFAFPSRRQYDRVAAARHWERLNRIFGETLGA